jgi:hypothetical protein
LKEDIYMAVEDVDFCIEGGVAGIGVGSGFGSDGIGVQTRHWNGRDICIGGARTNESVCFSDVVCANNGSQASASIQGSGGGNSTKDKSASVSGSATASVPVGSNTSVSVTGGASGSTSTTGGTTASGGSTSVVVTITRTF